MSEPCLLIQTPELSALLHLAGPGRRIFCGKVLSSPDIATGFVQGVGDAVHYCSQLSRFGLIVKQLSAETMQRVSWIRHLPRVFFTICSPNPLLGKVRSDFGFAKDNCFLQYWYERKGIRSAWFYLISVVSNCRPVFCHLAFLGFIFGSCKLLENVVGCSIGRTKAVWGEGGGAWSESNSRLFRCRLPSRPVVLSGWIALMDITLFLWSYSIHFTKLISDY